MTATPHLLEMQGIDKSFPGVKALDKVSLSVAPGEVVALIGENGAGKSTLMKVLGGVYTPDAGIIRFDGKPVTMKSVRDAMAMGIGFIHQELNVLDNLTIAGNVFLGREPLWCGPARLIDRREIHARTQPHLARLGLELSPETLLLDLSIAQQQMVEIAKALSLNIRLLIMDEPTSSLTLTETQRLFEIIRQLRSDGISIIYISHRLSEIAQCADRVVGLRDGRNAGELAKEAISHEAMVRLMIGRELADFYTAPAASCREGSFVVSGLRTQAWPDKHISFEAFRGEILGFAGLVGAGRSEMAQAVFGVEKRLSGRMTLDGNPLDISSARDAIAAGVYLAPEDRRKSGLVTEMTIRENITLPDLAGFAGAGLVDLSRERQAARQQCEALAVKAPSIETAAQNLSGGNQQKVVLARWLRLKPGVMIFDEPTRGIDVGAKSEIYHLMRQLADTGVVVIMISSDMEEILGVSDRIAVMHEGSITGILQRENFSEEAVMKLAVGA
jgi:ribose transport system ATP-binding protein